MTSRMSVAVIFIAPGIIRAVCLWINANLLIAAWLECSHFALFPMFCCEVRKMSAAYNIYGTAMDRYNSYMYFAFILHDAWAILPNWMSQSCPLARAVAHWAFQFSLLSTIIPRKCAMSFDCMHRLPRVSTCCGIGILSFGLCKGNSQIPIFRLCDSATHVTLCDFCDSVQSSA